MKKYILKNYIPVVLALVVFFSAGFVTAALTQTSLPANKSEPVKLAQAEPGPDQTSADTGAAAASSQASPGQGQIFLPGMDDLMTMLIQPRHIKVHYAGAAKNWELAAAEMRDLRSSFGRIAQTVPNYEGNDVNTAVADLIGAKMDAVDDAIKAADPAKFAAAYKDLTAGCNSCHTYMEHPFLVIKAPEPKNTVYPNQDFSPTP